MAEEPGGEWIRVYVRLGPSAVHLTPSQHCQSAKLLQKIKSVFFLKSVYRNIVNPLSCPVLRGHSVMSDSLGPHGL